MDLNWRTVRSVVLATVLTGALAACGASTTTSPSAPTPASTATGQTTPTESPSAPSTSAPAEPSAAMDPCEALTAAEVEKAFGIEITEAKETEVIAGSKLCSYSTADLDDPAVVSQTTPAMGSNLDALVTAVTAQMKDAQVSNIKGANGEDGRQITGTVSGAPAVSVLFIKNQVAYQVLATQSDGDVKKLGEQAQAAVAVMM